MPLDSSLLPLTWMLTCTALVLLMQVRFTCLETGSVRAKNSINVAIKNVVDYCIASIIFWAFGFGLMFGVSASGLFGTSQFLFDGGSNIQMWTFFLFQLTILPYRTVLSYNTQGPVYLKHKGRYPSLSFLEHIRK